MLFKGGRQVSYIRLDVYASKLININRLVVEALNGAAGACDFDAALVQRRLDAICANKDFYYISLDCF